jgi:mRNA interferase RelE/StbE
MSDTPYRIGFTSEGLRTLKKLDAPTRERVLRRLLWLAENFDNVPHQSLKGYLRDYFKFRIGDYRVLYTVEYGERLIIVYKVDNRDDVYED